LAEPGDSSGKAPADPGEEDTFGELFGRLVDDARDLIRAELEFYRAVMLRRLVGSKAVVVLTVIAVLLALGSMTALLVGLVLALAAYIGAFGATFAVGFGGLAIAALLIRLAVGRFRKMAKIADEVSS
jgi:hypothetical protein